MARIFLLFPTFSYKVVLSSKFTNQILPLIHSKGYLRARDLAEIGVSGATLQQLLRSGELVRIG
ncbi:MAG: type IV toxin-antitoxin system AbiEi family antitoxin domain-containing protein, partial [Limnobacter sp.]